MKKQEAISKASATRVAFHIEGVTETNGDVRLSAFIEKLTALRAALVESDHILSGSNKQSIDYLVTGLSHSSPAEVEVFTYSILDGGVDPRTAVVFLLSTIKNVRNSLGIPDRATKVLLGAIKRLVDGVGESFNRIWLTDAEGNSAALDVETFKAIAKLLPDVRRSYGSVRGTVKKYSGVGKQPYFQVYLPAGDAHVKCIFPPHLLEQAAEAVERTATIDGEVLQRDGENWPFEIKVKSIRVHKRDSDLPTLASLVGMAPMATGDMSTADFVRALHDGW